MTLFEELKAHKEKIAVVGLGYVGMPLAVELAKHFDVIGFDQNSEKVKIYKSGKDPIKEVGDAAILATNAIFTDDPSMLNEAKFFIVAVPTPVNLDKTPNLSPVENASKTVGEHLSKGSIVVYESTVYPGVTEEICIPILEKESGIAFGKDFKIGYSPERINPGDQVHRLTNIKKIVSGSDIDALETIKQVYDEIIEAGTHPVSSIKTAEAIKVVENSQRDINIAFMNELAMVFDRMGIDTKEVVEGMNTKWNALGFHPGLVGGHCIGVDPYYFTYEAEKLGYHSQIILAGRQVNDGIGSFIADAIIRELVKAGKSPQDSNIYILGMTFKENCPDIRNTKVIGIINRLKEYSVKVSVNDPWANKDEVKQCYNIDLCKQETINDADCVVVAVAHNEFLTKGLQGVLNMFNNELPANEKILIDIKSIYDLKELDSSGITYWRL